VVKLRLKRESYSAEDGLSIRASPSEVEPLNPAAREELEKHTKEFLGDVLQEAGRLEETQRTTSGGPEVTSTMVDRASQLVRGGYAKKRWPVTAFIAQAVAFIGTLLVGVATNHLDKEWGVILFAAGVVLAVISSTIVWVSTNR